LIFGSWLSAVRSCFLIAAILVPQGGSNSGNVLVRVFRAIRGLFCHNLLEFPCAYCRILSTFNDAFDMASHDYFAGRMVFGIIILLVGLTVYNWKFMLPFLLLIGSVILFLHLSRPKDSL